MSLSATRARGLSPAEVAAIVARATWRCRRCAGRAFQARSTRPARQRDAVVAVVGAGGEWSVDAIHAGLLASGVAIGRPRLRNLLARLAADGTMQRFDRGIYRVLDEVRP